MSTRLESVYYNWLRQKIRICIILPRKIVSQCNSLLKFHIQWLCHYTCKTNDIHTISPSAYWWTHNCIHKYALTILLNTRVLMILFLDSSKISSSLHFIFTQYKLSLYKDALQRVSKSIILSVWHIPYILLSETLVIPQPDS